MLERGLVNSVVGSRRLNRSLPTLLCCVCVSLEFGFLQDRTFHMIDLSVLCLSTIQTR